MTMKTLTAHVYGKDYALACDAGQEQHLANLVQQVNGRTQKLEKAVGKLSEPLMLLYTALMLADELYDAQTAHNRTKDELIRTQGQLNAAGDSAKIAALEEDMADSLQELAARIEGLAEKLAS